MKEIGVELDGKKANLVLNRSYCLGIKMRAHEGCTYAVSNKQKISKFDDHPNIALCLTGNCFCTLHTFILKTYGEMTGDSLLQ